jgi:hypothetical protein
MASTKGRKPTKKKTTKRKAAPRRKPAKKATSKKAAPKKTRSKAPTKRKKPLALSTERTHKLRRDQLAKWRYMDAEVRASVAELQSKMLELQNKRRLFAEEVAKNPEVLAAQRAAESAKANMDAARAELVTKKGEHDKYVTEFITKMGLDPNGAYSVDDETGLVRSIEEKQDG